ncbi:MAG: rhomboid family intramembrane serine protease [Actinomycetota bacterium]
MFPGNALIPIRDDNPTKNRSVVVLALIGLNIIFFFLEPQLGSGNSCRLFAFLYKWGVVPIEVLAGRALTGTIPELVPGQGTACAGVFLQSKSIMFSLFSSMFLHGGFLHLGGNMLFLWVFGNNIEDTLGKARFIVFYLLTGVLAGLAHVYTNPTSIVPTIGASGAVAGILGAYIVLFPRARVTSVVPIFIFLHFMRIPAAAFLGIWFVFQLLTGGSQQAGGGGVAWMAHVGGFIAGAILILAFGGLRRRHRGPELLA